MSRPKSAWAVADHRARRLVLQSARLAGWCLAPRRWPPPRRHVPARDGALDVVVAEVRAPLRRRDAFAEDALETGKRQNVARAVPAFDGLLLTPARPLSFWRTLGWAGAARGYTWGMELRGGCVVPAIAGGLCLLSNALFEAAVRAGFTIVERHGHTLEAIPPAPGTVHLDATVAFPDVDLVFTPRGGAARLDVDIERDELRVRVRMEGPLAARVELSMDERIELREGERWRTSRVTRRQVDARGAVLAEDVVARSARRILPGYGLTESCIRCGEHGCRDRPSEAVLVRLRGPAP